MSLSRDESRAVGFVLLLLVLAGAGRLVLRPPVPVPDLPTVDLARIERQSQAAAEKDRRAARPLGSTEKINVNAAPPEQLDRLPGIGPTLAHAVIAAREKDGPFAGSDDLGTVPGMSAGRIARLLPHLTFGASHGLPIRTHAELAARSGDDGASSGRVANGRAARAEVTEIVEPGRSRDAAASPQSEPGSAASPASRGRVARSRPASARRAGGQGRDPAAPAALVDPNTASAADLQKLPGIGSALAARIVALREKSGPFRTAEDLLKVNGIGPAKLAKLKPFLSLDR